MSPPRPMRLLDPASVPVAGVDAHLPALPGHRLTAAAVRQQVAAAGGWVPELPGDGKALVDRPPAAAAVLVPLVLREPGLNVLLTRRTEHLRDHAGQISFPGGRCEADDGSPAATALREAREEVGLDPSHVQVLGELPVYRTVTRYEVTPVIALVEAGVRLQPDPAEVAEAFEVPLAFLMNPAHHRRHVWTGDGDQRQFLSMPWQGPGADGVEREYFIWGATAAMLRNLYRLLAR